MCIQLCRLQRAVVRLRGAGGGESQRKSPVATYLQGLVTNDMAHLHPKARSIYSLFLNSKGRVLFDSLIYSTSDPDAFLLECDHGIVDSFQKHLKMYRINRKIDVDIVDKNVWAIYDDSLENTSKLKNCNINQSEDRIDIHKDPRTNLSGMRILTTSSISDDEMIKHINDPALQKCSKVNNYVEFRYRLGIPEGKENLPSGNSFPLEANCDYLNGISFQKGCYIGQELTARTYHTGVVRKRVMPIIFNDKIDIDIPHDTPVYDTNNPTTSIGKIRDAFMDTKTPAAGDKTEEEPEPIIFQCSFCKLIEKVHYKGIKPKFAKKTILKESSYIMRDPFSPSGKGQILVVGSDCSVCEKMVCFDKACSIFFTKTFCIDCAKINQQSFPPILKSKINDM